MEFPLIFAYTKFKLRVTHNLLFQLAIYLPVDDQ